MGSKLSSSSTTSAPPTNQSSLDDPTSPQLNSNSQQQHEQQQSSSSSNRILLPFNLNQFLFNQQSNQPNSSSASHRLSQQQGTSSHHSRNPTTADQGPNFYYNYYQPTFHQQRIIRCPICSHEIYPESEIEIHLVLCLTKPKLIYNEQILEGPTTQKQESTTRESTTSSIGINPENSENCDKEAANNPTNSQPNPPNLIEPEECSICLEYLLPGELIARLPCLCIYHKSCLDRWFRVNRVCPKHPD